MASVARSEGRTQTNPPIDLVALATNTLGNRDLELEVLRMFKAQSRSMMSRIDNEMTPALQKDLVHTLKGSARAVGAVQVALVCEGIEAELVAEHTPPLISLHQAVGSANAFIDELLEG
ncbi:Hpt domain-containing protein [Roseibium algae]|uniref:Hpt domain-containing protein n=1 Tax=Roseibium algae TaxID=3123038 RepID=A0ABU8TML8_9HYPH